MRTRVALGTVVAALALATAVPVQASHPSLPAPVASLPEWVVDGDDARPLTYGERVRTAATRARAAARSGDARGWTRAWQQAERGAVGIRALAPRDGHDGDVFIDTSVTSAGDLDGVKGDELVVVRLVETPDLVRTDVSVRRGTDGKYLWSKSFPGYGYALALSLGNPAKRGVVTVVDDIAIVDRDEGYAVAGRRTVTGFSATGAPLWEYVAPGGGAGAAVVEGAATPPLLAGVADALPGAAHDIVFVTAQFAAAGPAWVSGVELVAIDGSTGAPRPAGGLGAAVADEVNPTVVSDLSGDRLADVVFTYATPADEAVISAYRLVDGVPLWANVDERVDGWSPVASVGDQTGDKRSELAIGVATGFVVLSGADGAKRFAGEGDFAYALGDADRDRKPDVGVVSFGARDRAAPGGVSVRAYSATGRVLYTQKRSVPEGQLTSVGLGPIGDVHGDGVVDTMVLILSIRLGPKPSIVDKRELLDGRTGRLVHRAKIGVPLGAAVDGKGADFAAMSAAPGGLAVIAQQGSTGRALWQAVFPFFAGPGGGMNADGDRCADVVIGSSGSESVVGILRGADGRLLWAEASDGTRVSRLGGAYTGRDDNRAC